MERYDVQGVLALRKVFPFRIHFRNPGVLDWGEDGPESWCSHTRCPLLTLEFKVHCIWEPWWRHNRQEGWWGWGWETVGEKDRVFSWLGFAFTYGGSVILSVLREENIEEKLFHWVSFLNKAEKRSAGGQGSMGNYSLAQAQTPKEDTLIICPGW